MKNYEKIKHESPEVHDNNCLNNALTFPLFVLYFLAESLAQEMDMDRKTRQSSSDTRENRDRDNDSSSAASVKNTLADRSSYYKNSVLYSTAT